MFITEWKEEVDGSYWEAIASIREGLTPIFKLEIHDLRHDGKLQSENTHRFEIIIRDYVTSKMLSSKFIKFNATYTDPNFVGKRVKEKAIELAHMLLLLEGSYNRCKKLKKNICPHKHVSAETCNGCKLPELFISNIN